jgi:hypothetical protein
MPPFPTRLPRRCLLLLALALLATPAGAQEKPLLSAEIRSAFADGGAAAARARFRALFPDQADQYQVDPEALGELGLERMQQGDTEGMQAVMEFELGPEGSPTGLKHDVDELASPLARVGALPDGWGDECIPPPMR